MEKASESPSASSQVLNSGDAEMDRERGVAKVSAKVGFGQPVQPPRKPIKESSNQDNRHVAEYGVFGLFFFLVSSHLFGSFAFVVAKAAQLIRKRAGRRYFCDWCDGCK